VHLRLLRSRCLLVNAATKIPNTGNVVTSRAEEFPMPARPLNAAGRRLADRATQWPNIEIVPNLRSA
jgi:hypothetical protein